MWRARINATATPRRPRPSRSKVRISGTLQFEPIAKRSRLSTAWEVVESWSGCGGLEGGEWFSREMFVPGGVV